MVDGLAVDTLQRGDVIPASEPRYYVRSVRYDSSPIPSGSVELVQLVPVKANSDCAPLRVCIDGLRSVGIFGGGGQFRITIEKVL